MRQQLRNVFRFLFWPIISRRLARHSWAHLIVCVLIFSFNTSWGQTLRVCYIPDSRSTLGDRGYTFDGVRMINNSTPKLINPANFGPNGLTKRAIVPVPLTANPISATAIATAGCGAIFVGGFTIGEGITASELNTIRTWSMQGPTNLVVVTQGEATAWGYKNVNGNSNPNTPTAAGTATKIFNGPFGVVTSYNQGGSYQGSITGGTPIVLGEDAAKRPTIALDIPTGDIILGDVDILTDLGGISSGMNISNNNDRLFANIWAYATDLTSTERSLATGANTVFVDNGLGGGVAGNCTKDGNEGIPDVSKTSLYIKLVSGPAIVQIAPLRADGSFQFTSVPNGTYTLLLDDNNAVADITPVSAGGTVSWTGIVTDGTPGTPIKFCLLNCASNLPVASVTGSSSFCSGQTAPLSVSVTGGTGSYSYQWKQGTGNVGTGNNSFSATLGGVYSVAVSDAIGCLSTSNSLTITQKPSPEAVITANGPTAVVPTTAVVLSASASAGQTYQWNRDGTAISGATSSTLAANQQGNYTVSVTRDGCSATSAAITISIILAAEPVPVGFHLRSYPNPTDGATTIEVENEAGKSITLSLFNVTGQAIQTWEIKAHMRQQMLRAELPANGLYFLRADNGQASVHTKILKR